MLGFAESFLAWIAATAIPAFVGLLLVVGASKLVQGKYLAAFALGIFLWFFVDTIGGSANLDVNAGFTGGIVQVALVVLFAIGVLFFFSVDRSTFSPESTMGSLAVPVLVAIAVGIHGFGEGAAFGGTAASTSSASLLDAFGGVSAGVAYILHKMFEPMMIGACYCVYSKQNAVRPGGGRLGEVLLLTILFVIPSLIGAATGYYLTYDSSYFFALGTGTSIYAALRLARPLFERMMPSGSESIRLAVSVILGFICIYLAALFHS